MSDGQHNRGDDHDRKDLGYFFRWLRGYLRTFDAIVSSIVGSALFLVLTEASHLITKRHIPLPIALAFILVFLLLMHTYRFFVHVPKVKKFGKSGWFSLDSGFFALMLVFSSAGSFWAYAENQSRIAKTLEEKVSRGLLPAIATNLKQRQEVAGDVRDSHYVYDHLTINLYKIGRTGVVQHIMHGEPYSESQAGASNSLRFAYSGEAPIESIQDFMRFEVLDDPLDKQTETRSPSVIATKHSLGNTFILEVPGFSKPFWYRRTVCWPGALFRNTDAFLIHLSDYEHLRLARININFVSTDLVEADIHDVGTSPIDNNALLTYIEQLEVKEIEASHLDLDSDWLRGMPLKSKVGWSVPFIDKRKVLAVTFVRKDSPQTGEILSKSGAQNSAQ